MSVAEEQVRRQKSVLIVEDNETAASMLQEFLESKGYAVTYRLDGSSALEYIETHTPYVVFMDIQMPGMNGFEVVRKMRAHTNPAIANAIIVGVSALYLFDQKDRFRDQGLDAFVAKPFDMYHILDVLSSYTD